MTELYHKDDFELDPYDTGRARDEHDECGGCPGCDPDGFGLDALVAYDLKARGIQVRVEMVDGVVRVSATTEKAANAAWKRCSQRGYDLASDGAFALRVAPRGGFAEPTADAA